MSDESEFFDSYDPEGQIGPLRRDLQISREVSSMSGDCSMQISDLDVLCLGIVGDREFLDRLNGQRRRDGSYDKPFKPENTTSNGNGHYDGQEPFSALSRIDVLETQLDVVSRPKHNGWTGARDLSRNAHYPRA